MTIALVEKLSDVRDFRKILETTVKEIGETYSADLSQIVLSNPLDTNTTSICEYLSNPDEIPRAPRLTSFPLTLEGGGLGVLNIARSNQLDAREINEIRITLAEIANIIRYAQINDLVQRDTFRSAFMSEITSMMQMNMGLGDTLFMVVNILGKALNCSRCIFVCTDDVGAGWKCYEYWQRERGIESSQEYGWPTKDSAVISRALLSPMPVVTYEGQMGSYLTPAQEEMQFIGVRSLLSVGIRSTLGVHGCMVVQQCDSRRAWTRAETDMVQSVADTVAEALVQLPEEKRFIEPIMRLHQRNVFDTKDADQQSIQDVRKALKGVLGQASIPNARKVAGRPEESAARPYELKAYEEEYGTGFQQSSSRNAYEQEYQYPEESEENGDYTAADYTPAGAASTAATAAGAGALTGLADSIIADQAPAVAASAPVLSPPPIPEPSSTGGRSFPGVLGGLLGNARSGGASAGAWDVPTSTPVPPPPGGGKSSQEPWPTLPEPAVSEQIGGQDEANWNTGEEPASAQWSAGEWASNQDWGTAAEWGAEPASAADQADWSAANSWDVADAKSDDWGASAANSWDTTPSPGWDSPVDNAGGNGEWPVKPQDAGNSWQSAESSADWDAASDWGNEEPSTPESDWSTEPAGQPAAWDEETVNQPRPIDSGEPNVPPPAISVPVSPFAKAAPAVEPEPASQEDSGSWKDLDSIPTPTVRPGGLAGAVVKGGLSGIARSGSSTNKPASPFGPPPIPKPASKWGEPENAPAAEAEPDQSSSGSKWGDLSAIPTPGTSPVGQSAPGSKWGDLDQIPSPGNTSSVSPPAPPAVPAAGASKWGDLDSIGAKPASQPAAASSPATESRWGNLDEIPAPGTKSGTTPLTHNVDPGHGPDADQSVSGRWGNLDAIGTPTNASKGLGGTMLAKAKISSISTPGGGLGSSLMKDRNRSGNFVEGPPLEIDEAAAEAKLKQILSTSNPTSDYIFATPNVDARLLGRIDGWVSQVEKTDKYVNGHARAVAEYSSAVARYIGLPPEEVNRVRLAAIVHDIGKLKLPQALLQKPEEDLSDAELVQTMEHPIVAAKLLKGIPELQDLADAVLHHHEEWDGNGFPGRDNAGLAGEEIPLYARIIHVADGYHGRISDLTYRAGMTPDQAQQEMRDAAGTTYDPALVEALLDSINQGLVPAAL